MLIHPTQVDFAVFRLRASVDSCETPPPLRVFLRPYRAVLALHTGAVEAQRRDAVADSVDVNHALVASLAGLRLGKVSGPQGDRSNLTCRKEDFTRVEKLRAIL